MTSLIMKEIMSNTRHLVLVGLAILAWPTLVARASTNAMWDRQEFLGQLGNGPEVDRLVHAVARKPDYYAASDEIRVLEKTRTDQARAALLRIAYGEIGQQHVEEAAIYYAASLEDKSQGRALLVSNHPKVLETGFRTVIGQPLDEALLERVATAITNDSVALRRFIAMLLQADINIALAAIKTELLARSMKSTLECSDANQPINLVGESFFDEDRIPFGEWGLREQASLLGRTKGVTVPMIREALGAERGVVRDFAVLAMAYASTPAMQVPIATVAERKAALTLFATNDSSFFRGDPAVCAELYGVLTNSPNLTARFSAMSFLSWRPQQCDRAALDWVAKHDPFKSRPSPRYFMMPDADRSLENRYDAMIFPLRSLAEQSLRVLDARTNPPPTGP